jgi:two-component system, chemotaxis family, sensor kinase CheA
MPTSNNPLGKAIKDFLAESEEIINQLSLELVKLSDCADRGDYDPDVVNSIFRSAHSLKGLAGMFGFTGIAELAHNLENLLDLLRLGKIPLEASAVTILFDSLELLGALVRTVGEDHHAEIDISPAVQRINDLIAASKKPVEASPLDQLGLTDKVLKSLTEYEEHRLVENVRKSRNIYSLVVNYSLETFDRELGDLLDALKSGGEVISTLPSAEGNGANSISFEILFGSDKDEATLVAMLDRAELIIRPLGAPARKFVPAVKEVQDVEMLPDVPAALLTAVEEQGFSAKSLSRTTRVDIGKLDELMNIVGELVLSQSVVADLAVRLRSQGFSDLGIELGKAAKGFERKLNELQKGVMEIRMTPVGQLFDKMTSIVRKISREQGKLVELKIFGADTELDKMIIEDISDPLMHIIRNSIDHGIETPEVRQSQGKDVKGVIKLSSRQKGDHVVIEVEDDGKGIDLDRIKQRALQTGHIRSTEGFSDREVMELLFLPGFSTMDQVSEISGRGVGMDVVRNNIAALSGVVEIESVKDRGTRVVITLPITLAIIKVLLISVDGRTYAIPITSVQETLSLENGNILTVEGKEVMQLRETTLPLLRLSNFFGTGYAASPLDEYYVIVVRVGEKRFGMVADDLIGQQDIVIKPLGETFKDIKGFSGAADLSDQSTILILDVAGIINEVARSTS